MTQTTARRRRGLGWPQPGGGAPARNVTGQDGSRAAPATEPAVSAGRSGDAEGQITPMKDDGQDAADPSAVRIRKVMDDMVSRETVDQLSSPVPERSEEHTSELQSHHDLVCRLLLDK